MEHKKKISALFALLIVVGSLLYGQMPGTTPFGFLKKPTAISCGGTAVGGYCWYLGADTANCNTTCTSHGGCDLVGTRDYAGSGGTNANCIAIFTALGSSASWDGTASNAGGCQLGSGNVKRGTATTSCTASIGSTQRACACNN